MAQRIGIHRIHRPTVFRQVGETAHRFVDVEVPPGDYPAILDGMSVRVRMEGTVVASNHDALLAGVPVVLDRDRDVGERRVCFHTVYAHQVARAVDGGDPAWRLDPGVSVERCTGHGRQDTWRLVASQDVRR